MTWGQWIAALVATVAGSVLAVSFYLHWTYRFQRRVLGVVTETAFLVLMVSAGALAIQTAWGLHP